MLQIIVDEAILPFVEGTNLLIRLLFLIATIIICLGNCDAGLAQVVWDVAELWDLVEIGETLIWLGDELRLLPGSDLLLRGCFGNLGLALVKLELLLLLSLEWYLNFFFRLDRVSVKLTGPHGRKIFIACV
jgi:hypothetical protein